MICNDSLAIPTNELRTKYMVPGYYVEKSIFKLIIVYYNKVITPYSEWLDPDPDKSNDTIFEIDLGIGKQYVKEIVKIIRALNYDGKWINFWIEGYKYEKHFFNYPTKHWEDTVSEAVADWAHRHIMKNIEDGCIDNIRVALMSSPSQRRRYFKQKKEGCCGSYDEIVRGPWFKRYMIGCNYGH